MSFAGWPLASLLPFLLAAGGSITALYLLKTRRREVVVPFAALWEQVGREHDTRQLWKRLRRVLSWLLQILLLLAVLAAITDPQPTEWLRPPRDLAIILDHSASMSAPAGAPDAAPGSTRLDLARTRVFQELAALGPRDRVVIIAAGDEVVPLAPLAPNSPEATRALTGLRPSAGEADMNAAIRLASDLLARSEEARILVITDTALLEAEKNALRRCLTAQANGDPDSSTAAGVVPCELARIEGPTQNVALTAFAARRYPTQRERVEALVEVANLGESPVDLEVVVRTDDEQEPLEIARVALHLDAGQRRRETLRDLDAARPILHAQLVVPGAEATSASPELSEAPAAVGAFGPSFDDRAWAVIPPVSPIDVVLVSDGKDLFLQAALLSLEEHVRLTTVAPGQGAATSPELQGASLVIYDVGAAPLPEALPDTNLMIFDPHRVTPSPVAVEKRNDLSRPRLTEQDRKHPLLEGVVFKDVNISRGTSFNTIPGDQVLVAHLGEPLIVLREVEGRAILVIGFDPRQSDLPLRVAFPLFVANAVDWFEQRTPGYVAQVTAGGHRTITLRDLGLEDDSLTSVDVKSPSGIVTRHLVDRGEVRVHTTQPGVWWVTAIDGASQGASVAFAANASDTQLSTLSPTLDPSDDPAFESKPPPSAVAQRNLEVTPWSALMWLVVAVIALEWLTYQRRRTV